MRNKALISLLFVFALAVRLEAQPASSTARRIQGGTKPATCSAGPPADVWVDTSVTPPVLNVCGPTNTWNALVNSGTLDAATLEGKTWESPKAIGTGTPAAATFTSVTTSGSNGGADGTEGDCSGLTIAAGHDLWCPNSTAHAAQGSNNGDAFSTYTRKSDNLSVFSATTSAQLAGVISDETGSGVLVFGTSPTLTTPVIGVATATSVNKVAFTAPATSATLTIPDGVTLTGPASSGTVAALNQANTFTSAATIDHSAATGSNAHKIPVKASVVTTANGAIGYDSTTDMLHAAQASADAEIPQFTVTPSNLDCVNWVVSGSKYKLGTAGAACGSGTSSSAAVGNTTAVTANANTTSDQTLQELALSAAYLNVANQPILIRTSGIYTVTGVPTVTTKVKLCTVSGCGSGTVITLASIATSATVSASNNQYYADFACGTKTTGASGVLICHGVKAIDQTSASVTATAFTDSNTAASSTIDLTAALFVDFTVAFSSGSASNSATGQLSYIAPLSTPTATSLAFSGLNSGTNSSATMTVGTGATLTVSGSGVNNANQFKGNSTVAIADGGTGTASTLVGLVRGNASAMTAAELSGDVTTSGSNAATIAALAVTASKMSVVNTRRTCSIVIGADNGSALVDGDLGLQGRQCFVPSAATIVEITVASDAGTPSVQLRKNHAGTTTNLLSGALAAVGGEGASTIACAMSATSQTCLDGTTSSGSITVSTTSLAAGDWIENTSGTAGGTAKRVSVAITYTIN